MIAREHDVLARDHVLRLLPSASYRSYPSSLPSSPTARLLAPPIPSMHPSYTHTPVADVSVASWPFQRDFALTRDVLRKHKRGMPNMGPCMNRLSARRPMPYSGTPLSTATSSFPRRPNQGLIIRRVYALRSTFDFAASTRAQLMLDIRILPGCAWHPSPLDVAVLAEPRPHVCRELSDVPKNER